MRAALVVAVFVFGVACGSTSPKPAPAPIANAARYGCGDAAEQLEHATRDLREPEQSIHAAMRTHCIDDHWPNAAIECFAQMSPEDLATCAAKLGTEQRDAMFSAFSGSVAVAVAKLKALHVGIPDCDQLISGYVTVLTCDKVAFETRVELGNNTADFWYLPDKLPAAATSRMATACNRTLVELRAQFGESGCMP